MSLQDKAMLVSINIATWNGKKYDRTASNEVLEQHGAEADAGRFNKQLIAKDALKPTTNIATNARLQHYKYTLPWGQDGSRILPSTVYFEYMQMVREAKAKFEEAADDFCANYPSFVREARRSLGTLYDPSDYPSPSRIRAKFNVDVAVFPLPDSDDFRVTLNDVEAQRIKADIEKRMLHAQEIAMQDIWSQLHTAISEMIEKLSAYTGERKGSFRDSLVDNIRELVELLPKLNITNNQQLADAITRAKERLTIFDADTLRGVPYLRAKVITEANAILNDMAGYIGEVA